MKYSWKGRKTQIKKKKKKKKLLTIKLFGFLNWNGLPSKHQIQIVQLNGSQSQLPLFCLGSQGRDIKASCMFSSKKKKYQYICNINVFICSKLLTYDVVSFEQLAPDHSLPYLPYLLLFVISFDLLDIPYVQSKNVKRSVHLVFISYIIKLHVWCTFSVVLRLRNASLTQYIFQLALQYNVFGTITLLSAWFLDFVYSLDKAARQSIGKIKLKYICVVLFKLYQINNYIIK